MWSKMNFENRRVKSARRAEASPFEYAGHQRVDSKARAWSGPYLCTEDSRGKKMTEFS